MKPQSDITLIGNALCLVPEALSFSISGNGHLAFAKRNGHSYDVLFATLSLVHGGVMELGISNMEEKEAFKTINDFRKLSPGPLASSDLERLKDYLFGAYAYYLSLNIPEHTAKDDNEMRKALRIVGNEFEDTEYWLRKFMSKESPIRHELLEFITTHNDVAHDESGETAVFVNAQLKVSNPAECLDKLLSRDDFLLSERTSRHAVLDMVEPYKFDKNDQMDRLWIEQQKLIGERKSIAEINRIMNVKIADYNKGRNRGGPEKVRVRSLMLDGDSAYKRLGGIEIWSTGRINISANTISVTGGAVEMLAGSGAKDIELLSVEYLHWKEALKSREERKKAIEVSKLTAEAVKLLNKKTPEDDIKSVELLNKALEANPKDYDSLYMMCDVLLAENHTVEAAPLVERLLEIAPDNIEPHRWKAQVLMNSALDSGNRHILAEAMKEANSAFTLNKKSFDSAAMCAQLSYLLGERRHKLYVDEMKTIDKERAKRFMEEYFIY
jgi:tetratricopeptide (TPR) repeat protein